MIIFASFSVMMITIFNKEMIGENVDQFNLMYTTKVHEIGINDQLVEYDENQKYLIARLNHIVGEVVIDSFRVTIARKNGEVLADNGAAGEFVARNLSEDENFIKVFEGKDTTYSGISDYYGNQVIGCYGIVYNESYDEEFVVRIEMLQNIDNELTLLVIFLVFFALLSIMGASYFSIRSLVDNSITPLIDIHRNIIDVSKGDYQKYEVRTKYREMQRIIDEVNSVGYKISKNFKNLSIEREKSRFILDGMSQGVMAVSPEGTLVLMNKACMDILEWDKSLLGESVLQLIRDEKLREMLGKAVYSGQDMIFEHEISDRIYSVEVKQVSEEWYDTTTGFITLLTFSDITSESKSAEIRSEFFANASHELRTPLTAIKGFGELLLITGGKGTLEKCTSEIVKNTDKMLILIADMLDLSKMDAKLDDEGLGIVDLKQVAENVKNEIESLAISKNISINIAGQGKVVGVEPKLGELLNNLIGNSIKYNNKGGKINVIIESSDTSVILTVEDNGIGIASAHQSRVFERFYRVDKGRDRRVASTGLGLSIVKNIADMHRSKVEMSSKLGEGTKFTIQFPTVENFDSTYINNGDIKI